jgi:hypothetical protein
MSAVLEIQQTPEYQCYLKSLGWSVYNDAWGVGYYRPIPFTGTLMKLQRIQTLPDISSMQAVIKNLRINQLSIEPDATIKQAELIRWMKEIKKFVHITRSPFIPTKTIRVDLTKQEHDLFGALSQAKRRAVRRAKNLGICIEISDEIKLGIETKARAAGLFGFITTTGMQQLWNAMGPAKRTLILAYHESNRKKPIGCVFVVHTNGISYYWIAGATKKAKHLFAPTLLAWEAIRLSKLHSSHTFDFLGIWDERMPKEHTDWLGFSKFKEGFGGYTHYYPSIAIS